MELGTSFSHCLWHSTPIRRDILEEIKSLPVSSSLGFYQYLHNDSNGEPRPHHDHPHHRHQYDVDGVLMSEQVSEQANSLSALSRFRVVLRPSRLGWANLHYNLMIVESLNDFWVSSDKLWDWELWPTVPNTQRKVLNPPKSWIKRVGQAKSNQVRLGEKQMGKRLKN